MEEWDPLKDEEMNEYFNRQRLIDSQIDYARLKGIEEGKKQVIEQAIEQAIEQNKKETAINMIKEKIDLETISECLGLSLNEVRLLEKEIS